MAARARANAAKRGLEILGMALVDACERTAVFLTATQTVTDRKPKGKKVPDYLAHLDNPDSLIGLYLKAFARESDLSVESVKLLIHNAVVIQRILSMSGKHPNLNLNQENFKELLFYGVKTAA